MSAATTPVNSVSKGFAIALAEWSHVSGCGGPPWMKRLVPIPCQNCSGTGVFFTFWNSDPLTEVCDRSPSVQLHVVVAIPSTLVQPRSFKINWLRSGSITLHEVSEFLLR